VTLTAPNLLTYMQFHCFLPDCLHGLLPGPFLGLSPELIGFCFSFSLFFVSVQCARLGWLFHQLLTFERT